MKDNEKIVVGVTIEPTEMGFGLSVVMNKGFMQKFNLDSELIGEHIGTIAEHVATKVSEKVDSDLDKLNEELEGKGSSLMKILEELVLEEFKSKNNKRDIPKDGMSEEKLKEVMAEIKKIINS